MATFMKWVTPFTMVLGIIADTHGHGEEKGNTPLRFALTEDSGNINASGFQTDFFTYYPKKYESYTIRSLQKQNKHLKDKIDILSVELSEAKYQLVSRRSTLFAKENLLALAVLQERLQVVEPALIQMQNYTQKLEVALQEEKQNFAEELEQEKIAFENNYKDQTQKLQQQVARSIELVAKAEKKQEVVNQVIQEQKIAIENMRNHLAARQVKVEKNLALMQYAREKLNTNVAGVGTNYERIRSKQDSVIAYVQGELNLLQQQEQFLSAMERALENALQ